MTTGALVSYSTNHEDILLARAFAGVVDGFFVDIGAHHPLDHSVTRLLSERGWSGVNVEPNPGLVKLFDRERPRDVNLAVAVSSQSGSGTFHEVLDSPQLSTLSSDLAAEYRRRGHEVVEQTIPFVTLADICRDHAMGRAIEFVSIDVEGAERDVLAGADFAACAPKVLLIESTLPMTNTLVHSVWEHLIPDSLYQFTLFDGINRVYVRRDEPELLARLSYPVNCLDNFVPVAQHNLHQIAGRYYSLSRPLRGAAHAAQMAVEAVKRAGRRGRLGRP